MINGLKEIFMVQARWFVTIRLGPKWADKLNPGDRIAISISDNPKRPNIIGHAEVAWVKKGTIDSLTQDELLMNIGAKKAQDVWLDMRKVYNKPIKVGHHTISVLALFVSKI